MKPVQIHISRATNVYQNLAYEEYLVTQSQEDILLFYINTDAVVIGKHQNPWKEVDLSENPDQIETHRSTQTKRWRHCFSRCGQYQLCIHPK